MRQHPRYLDMPRYSTTSNMNERYYTFEKILNGSSTVRKTKTQRVIFFSSARVRCTIELRSSDLYQLLTMVTIGLDVFRVKRTAGVISGL
jgi:hypothetical protein